MSDTPTMLSLKDKLYEDVRDMLKKREPIHIISKYVNEALFDKGCSLERENNQLREALKVKDKTICFFASVIKSGEAWSDTCESEMKKALPAVK